MTAESEPSLRRMRWWDIEPAAALERELFGPTAWSAETFWSELARPSTRDYLVAERDEALLGYAGLMLTEHQADVQTVAVAPAGRGTGLGSRLLTALLDAARERGAGAVLLEVRSDNAAAIALYSRHGFERIAVRRGYYQPERADAWVMRRGLGRPGPDEA